MLDVNTFDNVLYLSPSVVVYENEAKFLSSSLEELDTILEMCEKERYKSIPFYKENGLFIVKLKNKE